MRPTDLIRELLVMRLVQQAAKREENRLMEEMKANSVQLVELEDRPVDIYVRIRDNGWEHHACNRGRGAVAVVEEARE